MIPLLYTVQGEPQRNVLLGLALELGDIPGEIWECGVYRGGSAECLQKVVGNRILRLFDTFGPGIPVSGHNDTHIVGDFSITSDEEIELVEYFSQFENVKLHKGIIPETFKNLDKSIIALAHVDVDQGETYKACIDFIWPRLSKGGSIVFDDYGVSDCVAATDAVLDFARDYKLEIHEIYDTHGCYITK